MRPSNEELLAGYIADLESDIACNAKEIEAGRMDLDEYDDKCRAQLAVLRSAPSVNFDRFGQPVLRETPATKLLRRALESIKRNNEDIGGCDHSVGICNCADIGLAEEIGRFLAAQEGYSRQQ